MQETGLHTKPSTLSSRKGCPQPKLAKELGFFLRTDVFKLAKPTQGNKGYRSRGVGYIRVGIVTDFNYFTRMKQNRKLIATAQ